MADLKQYVTIKNAQGVCLVCVLLDKNNESMGFEKKSPMSAFLLRYLFESSRRFG